MGLFVLYPPEFFRIVIDLFTETSTEVKRRMTLVLIPDPLRSRGYLSILFTGFTGKYYASMLLLSRLMAPFKAFHILAKKLGSRPPLPLLKDASKSM